MNAVDRLAILEPVVYHGRPIVVYRCGRFDWNARVADPSWSFPYGYPFHAMTPARALAKAKRWVDWRLQQEALDRAIESVEVVA